MRRIHWFEFHDLAWFPTLLRDALTEWLRVLWAHIDANRVIAPVMAELLQKSHATQVVDLCSGGSGPLLGIQQEFEAAGWNFKAVITDKYPNVDAMEETQVKSKGSIQARLSPVDASDVPRDLGGLRTLFNAFHHFRRPLAQAILRDAYLARQPIGIFEIPNRGFSGLAFSFIGTFVGVLLLAPRMQPRRPIWLVLTYLVPVIPFIVGWDGWVSHLRAYTPAEMMAMVSDFSQSYCWEVRTLPVQNGRFIVTCLLGLPTPGAV
jgi:hypothetical protein